MKELIKKWWFWVIVAAIVAIVTSIVFIFISKEDNRTQNQMQERITAEEIANSLKEKGLNVGRIVTYTEENDLNNLLGRPNQYISKATFEDNRIEQRNQNLDEEYFSEEERNEPTRRNYRSV